jgi:hypothetical protein
MKTSKMTALILIASFVSLNLQAQKIKIAEGSLSVLKDEKIINIEFTYDNMKVGKFDKEADYISTKKEEYNKKEPGRGDTWAKAWADDRAYRFEPKFNELFEKYSELVNKKDAKYTLVIHTTFTEPGYNVGVWRKNAEINLELWVVETANRGNVAAKVTVDKAPGRTFWGGDYDTGERISECYADAGKAIGKFIKDKSK